LPFDTITFDSLERTSNIYANAFRDAGIGQGSRIALMVPPGLKFVQLVFALFKTGATLILIDPGMGRDNLVKCLSESKPDGIVGTRLAHSARKIYGKWFPDCKNNFVIGGSFPGCASLKSLEKNGCDSFEPIAMSREDEAAIIFTTGSTGPPKGVMYRHRIFLEQARQIRDYFQIPPGSVDVSGFPLFALFNTAMGTATVFPDMDATRPADIFPPNLIHAVETFNADQSFGSPALWNTVSKYCESENRVLPSIKRILSAGAPVPPHVLKRIKSVIAEDGEAFTPYGATEALPVACISASEVLPETAQKSETGAGTCVGKNFPDMTWRLIEISDEPIASIDKTVEVAQGEIGELIVQGQVVTDQYLTRTDANAEHKIKDGETFWHRMGDVGYFDPQGRFWFCGRKSHRLLTADGPMFTVPCESIINSHSMIYRNALVAAGKNGSQVPVIFAEPWPEQSPTDEAAKANLIQELRSLASKFPQTASIQHFVIYDRLPVDIRHNSKIFREKLRSLADIEVARASKS
jgi:acyl-CoA synthetase (AMP-forming)/AMP-acid ligase II